MSMLHQGKTSAKALRDVCNFPPKFTGVAGPGEGGGSSILNSKASVGEAGPQVKKESLLYEEAFPSEFAIIISGFCFFSCFRWWST